MSQKSDLAFCYVFPEIDELTKGIVILKNGELYVKLIDYGLDGFIIDYWNVNQERFEKIRKKLVGKVIKVKVIRTDKVKGYIDVRKVTSI
ncbi:EIF2a-like PKR inhibitor [Deerpox virus W-1170-84]|uniref:eIF2a-like PKR inhibitor n=1 Tax=Deerpox virus (strain W-1170-84) TaxID=305676 RepID=Q08FG0_DPV84|nr:EIF2a-like PKR inhibitor [Deerpox virus W-1170-84]